MNLRELGQLLSESVSDIMKRGDAGLLPTALDIDTDDWSHAPESEPKRTTESERARRRALTGESDSSLFD